MDTIIKAMLERRSCRSYKTEMPAKEEIEQVVQAGLYAASGMGKQSPIIIAVTDKATRDKLAKLNAAVMGRDGDPFYGAPAVLVVLADKSVGTYKYDGSLTMGNMLLAASALGLGSCWIHRAKEEFESEEGLQILKDLGIEGEYEGIGNCILGYPAADLPAAAPRKEKRAFYID